jgi:hypothetical protein
MGNNEKVNFACHYLNKTNKAIHVHGGDNEVWIPFSQISDWAGDFGDFEDLEETDVGLYMELEIPEWLAIEKGIL